MDDLHAVVAKPAAWARRHGFPPRCPTRKSAVMLVGLECAFGAFDDDTATMVATHDIHCNSHKEKSAEAVLTRALQEHQAPAVTVMTWRPL